MIENQTVEPIWRQTVDNDRFTCQVDRTDDSRGLLTVTVTETQVDILSEPVPLLYGAVFGPDVADVAEWQEKSIVAIDQWIADQ